MRVGIPARTLCRDYLPLPIVRTINSAWGLRERLQNFRPGAAWKGRLWVTFRPSQPCPECRKVGYKRTSISGRWTSESSQDQKVYRQARELVSLTCRPVNLLNAVTSVDFSWNLEYWG